MTVETPSPDARVSERPRELAAAALWHGLWTLAAAGALVALGFAFGPLTRAETAALVFGAVPGVVAQQLWLRDSDRGRAMVVGVWTGCVLIAVAITGGLLGPFAAWSAAPLAAAVALDRRKLAAAGGALAMFVVGAGLAVSLFAPTPAPTAATPWLGLVGVGSMVAGFAAALSLALRRASARTARANTALERLEQLLTEQPHLIVSLDETGRVLSAFGAAPPGVPSAALLEGGLIAAVHAPDRGAVVTALNRAGEQGEAEVGFTPRAALDRQATLTVRRAEDGRLIGVLRDSSVEHARAAGLEAAKAEAEALNAGKSRFLANMSHELRTPLNAVIGFSDIMRQKMFGPLPDKYFEYAQLIHESGGHLLALINDILDMSKIEAERYELARERFDARDPVSAALRLVRLQAHENDIELRAVLPDEPLPVEADRRALKQISLNLVTNALKFTPAGGVVTVTVRTEGEVLEVVVADTGVGIAPEDIARIGRPFEQAGDAGQKARGTGLGLSLVRALAELHGGEMTLASALGEGTTVTVRLPVVRPVGSEPGAGAEIIPLNAQR